LNGLPEDERASAACLGLPDPPEVTPLCMEALLGKRVVRLEQCRVVNDFKLLQISWAWDLNFPASFRLLLERGYLPDLAASISAPLDLTAAVGFVMAEVARRAQIDKPARHSEKS
jgi:hypothetical protein